MSIPAAFSRAKTTVRREPYQFSSLHDFAWFMDMRRGHGRQAWLYRG